MGKKSGLGFLGLAAAAGAAAAVVKYMMDYTDFKAAAEGSIHEFEGSAEDLKHAAKRTYTSLSHGQTGELKEAAGDLAKAAGSAAKDAGSIAKAAGQSVVSYAKDTKARYDEDPEAVKEELSGNLKGIADDLSGAVTKAGARVSEALKSEKVQRAAESVKNGVKGAVSSLVAPETLSYEEADGIDGADNALESTKDSCTEAECADDPSCAEAGTADAGETETPAEACGDDPAAEATATVTDDPEA